MVYFRLAYIQQTLGVLQRSDALLNQVQEAAEARYRVGQGNQHDVLKVQLQHTKILQEIAHHHQEEGLLEAQIKQVLGRPQESADIVAETITAQLFRTPQPNSCRGLASRILMFTQKRPPFGNRKPKWSWHTRISAPTSTFNTPTSTPGARPAITTWRHLASGCQSQPPEGGISRSGAEPGAGPARTGSESQRVLSEVQQQYVRAKTSEEQLKIYSDGLVPQSEATFQSALSAYQSNSQDFESLLSGFLDVLNLDLEYRYELVEHESALAELERLTGVDLP